MCILLLVGGCSDAGFADTTLVFRIDRLSIPAPSGGATAGIDLDMIDSGPDGSPTPGADCEHAHPDFVSLLDPNEVGIDNAMGGLVPRLENLWQMERCPHMQRVGCSDARLTEDIASGAI
ncbi:MAG: hypothetical protein AB7S26_41595 [Sandaracinaceae bacterium]